MGQVKNPRSGPVLLERLSHNLRHARRERGWTQTDLARHLRVDKTLVSRIEQQRVNVTLATLERLAVALQVSPVDLLS